MEEKKPKSESKRKRNRPLKLEVGDLTPPIDQIEIRNAFYWTLYFSRRCQKHLKERHISITERTPAQRERAMSFVREARFLRTVTSGFVEYFKEYEKAESYIVAEIIEPCSHWLKELWGKHKRAWLDIVYPGENEGQRLALKKHYEIHSRGERREARKQEVRREKWLADPGAKELATRIFDAYKAESKAVGFWDITNDGEFKNRELWEIFERVASGMSEVVRDYLDATGTRKKSWVEAAKHLLGKVENKALRMMTYTLAGVKTDKHDAGHMLAPFVTSREEVARTDFDADKALLLRYAIEAIGFADWQEAESALDTLEEEEIADPLCETD